MSSPTASTPVETGSLEDGLAAHLAAIMDRDLEAFIATIGPDPVVLVTAAGEVTDSRDHLIELHRDWFRSTTWSIEPRTLRHRDYGRLGSCLIELHYRDTMDDGDEVHEVSILNLLFQLHEGRWLMIHDQNTPVRPA